MKKLLVCGGRDFTDEESLATWMREAITLLGVENRDQLIVIHGGARGADRMAGVIAAGSGVEVCVFPAQWQVHGRCAGFVRNRKMLEEGQPDMVLAAPGGRGTDMMVRLAAAAGVPVLDKRSAQDGRKT